MVNGVVSLRCPACLRPFLSLPQQQGTMVTCPHCARSAAMETYEIASGVSQQPAASLPIQRRIQPLRRSAISGMQPAAIPPPASVPHGPAWPPAPEQPPQFSPQTHPLFPPAPAASPHWQPLMPSGNAPWGFSPGLTPPITEADGSFIPGPDVQTGAVSYPLATVPQLQPGGAAVGGGPYLPPRNERNVPLGLFLLALVGLGGWFLWSGLPQPMAAEFDAPALPLDRSVPEPVRTVQPEPAAMPLASEEKAVSAVENPMGVEPEIRRAQLPDGFEMAGAATTGDELNLVKAQEAAEQLWAALLKAGNFTERAVLIADAEEQQVEIEGYFEQGKPPFSQIKLAKAVPRMLPGQEQVPLFQILSGAPAKTAAFLRLVPQEDGSFLLDWPLFAETAEGRLVRFLKQQSGEPAWFHVVMRRSHGLELAEAARAGQLCFSLQVNGEEPESSLAQVTGDTPLGRFFEREVAWGNTYVTRLLLQHRPGTGGTKSVVILDCEGAVTGAVFPGGSGKR